MKRWIREQILARDKYRCVACRSKKFGLVIHHVIPESEGGADNEQNVVTLCRPCHMQVTGFHMYQNVSGSAISALCQEYLRNLFGDSWEPHSSLWRTIMGYAREGAKSMARDSASFWDVILDAQNGEFGPEDREERDEEREPVEE